MNWKKLCGAVENLIAGVDLVLRLVLGKDIAMGFRMDADGIANILSSWHILILICFATLLNSSNVNFDRVDIIY